MSTHAWRPPCPAPWGMPRQSQRDAGCSTPTREVATRPRRAGAAQDSWALPRATRGGGNVSGASPGRRTAPSWVREHKRPFLALHNGAPDRCSAVRCCCCCCSRPTPPARTAASCPHLGHLIITRSAAAGGGPGVQRCWGGRTRSANPTVQSGRRARVLATPEVSCQCKQPIRAAGLGKGAWGRPRGSRGTGVCAGVERAPPLQERQLAAATPAPPNGV